MSFGKIVQNLRLLCHPTLDRFCADTGLAATWIERIESGAERSLTDEEIVKLAEALAIQRGSRTWLRFVRLAPHGRVS